MATMLVIINASGKIIAAMHEKPGCKASLLPLKDQRMHRLQGVPLEIAGLVNPTEFHRAITKHFHAKSAKVSTVSPARNKTAIQRRKS
jgi:hypothetical protein